ncbi:MAG: outer membrane lipoprotein carrier protein LolA [Nitrospirae bacterium]|nr:outer membrane lipoprotein carrier protein LolA [Nitrospirota bacterium]MBI3593868.1 outer membrane lipoprotein carrier protein LolA [Nitrospirota bacterium]
MAKIFQVLSLSVLMTFLFLKTGLANDSALEALLSHIQDTYNVVTDITASFEQETTLQEFKTSIKSSGNLYLKKKDKMKLAYNHPRKEMILINGREIMTFLPDEHQAVKGIFSKEQESRLPMRLLSGEAILKDEFQIHWDPRHSNTRILLLLIPLQKDSPLEKVELEIDPVTFLIKQMKLFQENQNTSLFIFSNVRINRGIKESFFLFTPPEGTEILNSTGSTK